MLSPGAKKANVGAQIQEIERVANQRRRLTKLINLIEITAAKEQRGPEYSIPTYE